jgi:hypothetical protein
VQEFDNLVLILVRQISCLHLASSVFCIVACNLKGFILMEKIAMLHYLKPKFILATEFLSFLNIS